jgi:ketosteroid isomerase-like protein
MPATNVDVVRSSFEAHTAGGIEAALRFYSRDFVWDPGPDWIEDRVYRGHDGARALDAVFTETFDDYAIEAQEILAVGDRVLALYEAVGTVKGSGAPVRQPFGIVLSDFHDGTIGKVRSYFSWQEAREAVGLAG